MTHIHIIHLMSEVMVTWCLWIFGSKRYYLRNGRR